MRTHAGSIPLYVSKGVFYPFACVQFSQPRTETGYAFRPSRLARSVSQWDLGDGGHQGGHPSHGGRVGVMEASPRSQHSSSSWDLSRPQTMSSTGSFSSPPPYHVTLDHSKSFFCQYLASFRI